METKNIMLKNYQVNDEIIETYGNENTAIQNLWCAAKTVLRGKFIGKQVSLKKKNQEKSQMNKPIT